MSARPGFCKRHPHAKECLPSARTPPVAASAPALEPPVVGGKRAPAIDQLGVLLLGLPRAGEPRRTRTASEEARPGAAQTIPDAMRVGGHRNFTDWLTAHPLQPHSIIPPPVMRGWRFALCLWGIAGVQTGPSRGLSLSPESVFQCADTHIRLLLEPAEASGWETVVFVHPPPT